MSIRFAHNIGAMSLAQNAIHDVRHVRREMAVPEDFGDAVTGLSLSIDFLGKCTTPAVVEQLQTQRWGVDFGRAEVSARVKGSLPMGWTSFCMVEGGESHWNGGHEGTPGALLCLPPNEELDGRISTGFSWITLALPPELWRLCQSLAGLEGSHLDHFTGWQLTHEKWAYVRRELLESKAQIESAGADFNRTYAGAELARAIITDVGTSAWESLFPESKYSDSLRNRYRLARRAADWLHAHLAESVQIPDVCRALHTSRRELEYSFRATFDLSPRAYLQSIRLNAIRRAFCNTQRSGETVATIAVSHGILHLGRFAAAYSRLFGEHPHQTLQRHKAGA